MLLKKQLIKKTIYFYIKSTYKNTLITLVEKQNNSLKTIMQLSTKRYLNKAKKQYYTYGLNQILQCIIKKFNQKNLLVYFRIYIKGFNNQSLRLFKKLPKKNFRILTIIDQTFIPFNGCRGKKVKRR